MTYNPNKDQTKISVRKVEYQSLLLRNLVLQQTLDDLTTKFKSLSDDLKIANGKILSKQNKYDTLLDKFESLKLELHAKNNLIVQLRGEQFSAHLKANAKPAITCNKLPSVHEKSPQT